MLNFKKIHQFPGNRKPEAQKNLLFKDFLIMDDT